MANMPKSYIEIDGLRIEGDSRLVLAYAIAVKNALHSIEKSPGKDVWVGVDGVISADDNGTLTVASHTQAVRLTAHSRINYQIVEDDYSRSLFADGTLGSAGKRFTDAYCLPEDETEDPDKD